MQILKVFQGTQARVRLIQTRHGEVVVKTAKDTCMHQEIEVMRVLEASYFARTAIDDPDPRSKNVVMMVDCLFEQSDTCRTAHLFVEYVHGCDLFDAVHRLKECETARIVKHMLLGLQYIHDHDFAHMDMSPENVLIGSDGSVKIADFGLAVQLTTSTGTRKYELLPGVSGGIGKVPYMAPELYSGKDYDGPACDVWSVGATVFAVVAKASPFMYPNAVDQNFRRVYNRPITFIGDATDLCREFMGLILCSTDRRAGIDSLLAHAWVN
jgi:serine/threonine protein kinase